MIPNWPGWQLIGRYPEGDPDGVGSWLLTSGGEAMLLERPPGLTADDVRQALIRFGTTLRYITASHTHGDHLDPDVWAEMLVELDDAEMIRPSTVEGDRLFHLGGEPLWLIKAPKHSVNDVVTVFRGVAMTGDIELGTLASVNNQVPRRTKRESMRWLRDFPTRCYYSVHSIVSAHLNDVRQGVNWPSLFEVD